MSKIYRKEKTAKIIFFSLIIFHKAEDLKKAFEIEWFQTQINEKYKLSNLKAGF
jgi:hypothetical protein